MQPAEFAEYLVLRGSVVAGFSDDDFFEICQANELLVIERTAARELLLRLLPGFHVGALASQCLFSLRDWSRLYGGRAVGLTGFCLPDGSVLAPSVSWLSSATLASLTREQLQKFPPICPVFVIEIQPPELSLRTMQARMQQWLANGVQLAFLLTDQPETAYVYRPSQPVEIIQGFDNELSGEPVLPGFRLDLRELRVEE